MKVVDKQGAAGVDRQTVDEFWAHHKEELATLQQELKTETYRPLPVRRVEIEQVIATLSRTLRGWFNYFRHCFWNVFDSYDEMVRKRLRRILLKRHRRNPERLPRTRRWPNAYFSELGLYSLREGHTRFVQSVMGY